MKWPQNNPYNFSQIVSQSPKDDNRENILRLVTAVLTLVSVLLSLSARFSKLAIPALCVLAVVLLGPIVSRFARRLRLGYQRRRFVRRERVVLADLLRRFTPFVDENQSSSIVCIVRSLCSNHSDAIDRILPAHYAVAWVTAFQQQLAFSTGNVNCFMTRCEEFVSIVNQFNRDYVLRTQKAIERGERLKEHDIDDLERFREEFSAYLRLVEDWVERLVKAWSAIEHDGKPFGTPFASHFERLKSFRRIAAQAVK